MAQTQSEEYKALKEALASKTEPSAAAHSLTKPTKQAFAQGGKDADLEEPLSQAWRSIIEVAAETPYQSQDALIKILKAVQQESLSEGDGSANKVEIWGEKVEVFKDLPLFGIAVRDAWNKRSGSKSDFPADQWVNLNSFIAQLTALSSSSPPFDFSLYAIWALRAAAEQEAPQKADVDAGKLWLSNARELIEKLGAEEKKFDGALARPGEKYKEKKWAGFTAERLEIWKEAL
ncbi:hypothetical protein B0O99DRAFT_595895 [Bisporella sp. PMI_857]|nr:hypothetical protein B0O99DRAFT_595895 [Bisporella sp. PMI_857]